MEKVTLNRDLGGRLTLSLLTLVLLLALLACSGSDGTLADGDADDELSDAEQETSDGDTVSDGDTESEGENAPRLMAATGHAVLSPTAENHPETIYLGGVFPFRIGTEVHDDLLASVLALKQGEEQLVIVSVDFLGFTRSRGREIQERLAEHGLKKEHILIAATHTHEAPDTIGVFGPDLLTSGVSPTYMTFLQDRIVQVVLETWERLVPVSMRAVKIAVDDPLPNYSTLIRDFRQPEVTVDYLSAAAFDDLQGDTVASLVNWHSHPEVMIDYTLISSDFPHWTRLAMEQALGGGCVYISGAIGGLATPTGVKVPARDEDGKAVMDGEEPLYLEEASWEKTRSLGLVIAEMAVAALDTAETHENPTLLVQVEEMLIPLRNPIMQLAFSGGLVQYDEQDLVKDRKEFCGSFGCASERLALVRLGNLAILSSPGETFPETVVGRPASSYDYGGDWGLFEFDPIVGTDSFIKAEVPMHLGLCGEELGYLIPEADVLPVGHPDYYEEDLFFGEDTESVYRQSAIDLLERFPGDGNR